MKQGLWVLLLCGSLVGCAALQQAQEDVTRGRETPLMAGEVAPAAQASGVTASLSALPVVGPFAPLAVPVLTMVFCWLRGRRLRKGQPVSTNPITGTLGKSLGVEFVIQHLVNVVKGLYEVGPEGSGLKRAWKVGISVLLAIVGAAVSLPAVKDLLTTRPELVALITGLAATVGGVEKEASKVLEVQT